MADFIVFQEKKLDKILPDIICLKNMILCREFIIFSEEIDIQINKYNINYVRFKEALRVVLQEAIPRFCLIYNKVSKVDLSSEVSRLKLKNYILRRTIYPLYFLFT